MSLFVDEGNRPAIVPWSWMIQEGDFVALRSDANVAYPPSRLVENVSDWILEPVSTLGAVGHGKLTIRIPISPGDVLEDFAGRTSGQGCSGKHPSFGFEMPSVIATQGHG